MIFLFLFILELFILFFVSQILTKSLSILFYKVTGSRTVTINLLSFLFLPGVVIHELSHMLSAALLMVPVGEIEFLPKVSDNGVKLGSVEIGRTDPIRRAIIGFAPVLAGTALIISLIYFIYSFSGLLLFWKFVIIFYVVFEIGNTMFSSRKDLEGTIELLLVFLIIFVSFYLLGARVPENFINFVFSEANIELIKKGNLFLVIPILADLLFIGLTKILSKK